MTVRSRRALFAAGTAALVVVATLLLAELALRVGALFVGFRPQQEATGSERERVLCLGDSNTYGVFFPPEDAYPGQLQTILDRRAPGRFHVLNLGLPGMSSEIMAARLPGWLEQHGPSTLVVTIGLNNYWNRTEGAGDGRSSLESLRLVRLWRLITAGTAPRTAGVGKALRDGTGRPELEREALDEGAGGERYLDAETGEILAVHEGDTRDWSLPHEIAAARLQRDLESALSTARAHDSELVLKTYAAFTLPWGNPEHYQRQLHLNAAMRDFATRYDVPIVDVRDRFLELLPPDSKRARYFANEMESHPNPTGYREIAQLVANQLFPADERVVRLLDLLDEAEVDAPETGYTMVKKDEWFPAAADYRVALFQHPPSTVTFHGVEIAPDTHLDFGVAVSEFAWDKPGDGVQFRVRVLREEAPVEVFAQYVDPIHEPGDRRWFNQRISLDEFRGESISLEFRTDVGPAGNAYFDWSAWSDPRLTSPQVGR